MLDDVVRSRHHGPSFCRKPWAGVQEGQLGSGMWAHYSRQMSQKRWEWKCIWAVLCQHGTGEKRGARDLWSNPCNSSFSFWPLASLQQEHATTFSVTPGSFSSWCLISIWFSILIPVNFHLSVPEETFHSWVLGTFPIPKKKKKNQASIAFILLSEVFLFSSKVPRFITHWVLEEIFWVSILSYQHSRVYHETQRMCPPEIQMVPTALQMWES